MRSATDDAKGGVPRGRIWEQHNRASNKNEARDGIETAHANRGDGAECFARFLLVASGRLITGRRKEPGGEERCACARARSSLRREQWSPCRW